MDLRASVRRRDGSSGVDQYGEQYGNVEPGEVSHILCELSWLAKSADAERAGVYPWMR
jgi:hypothetical protein